MDTAPLDEGPDEWARDAAIDIMQIGLSAIPGVGNVIAGVIGAVEARRIRRRLQLVESVVSGLQEGLEGLTRKLDDPMFQSLIDDAIDRSERIRNEEHIGILAAVVVKATEAPIDESLDAYHILLAAIGSLTPSHVAVMTELGTVRNINDGMISDEPRTENKTNQKELAHRIPGLKSVIDPVLAELRSGGLIDQVDESVPIRPESHRSPSWHLTDFGVWVLRYLRSHQPEGAGESGC